MVFYPVAQIICFIPATINRLYNIINKQDQFALSIIHSIFDYSLGFIITLIFVFSPTIKYSLLSRLKKLCKKQNRDTNTTILSEEKLIRDFNNSY
jgi:hypothetical protein